MERLTGVGSQSIDDFFWPQWVTDRKHSNVGLDASGNRKMCDYAQVKVIEAMSSSEFL